MWVYDSKAGTMGKDGYYYWTAYSGHGEGLNNPSLEQVPNVGPIPRGRYILGTPQDHPKLGDYAIPIIPAIGTNTFGRSGFFLHGDFEGDIDRSASEGCIIKSPKSERQKVWNSNDHELTVV